MAIDYKQAGVDVEAGDALVDWLKSQSSSSQPHQDRLVSGVGGFAALFRADFQQMKKPCLVSCTDGVGTKLKVAVHFKEYSGVAQDLVAMCVNDMLCAGAEPLFFLDYYATGKLDLEAAKDFLTGLRAACHEAQCSLIGGETAEMPGVYHDGDFDCAGFSVGVVDEELALGAHRVNAGDHIIAVASSGFHSNGFSLLRKVFAEDMDQWRSQLLEPTRLYVKPIMPLVRKGWVQAMAHITGGGLDNITRVLPEGLCAQLQPWEIPAPFQEVARRAELSQEKLLQTLNCGLGLAMIVRPENTDEILKHLQAEGHKAWQLGLVQKGEKGWSINEE